MHIDLDAVTRLELDDGSPVRAASAIARLGAGWLVAQDDSTHAAWWRGDSVRSLRILPAVGGHETFDEVAGTKHLKPDLEAACEVELDGGAAVLLLGSGSAPARMRGALVVARAERAEATHADLGALYAVVADCLSVGLSELNLEGACVVGRCLRWFHRGLPAAGRPSASVDLDLTRLLGALRYGEDPATVAVRNVRRYDLGESAGVPLAATDAVVVVPGAGTAEPLLLVSAAAEDTPNPRDDGPVVGSGLVLLDGASAVASAALPEVDGRICKVEGLALVERAGDRARVLATVDDDDHTSASLALHLSVRW